jgi:hypothetical protein
MFIVNSFRLFENQLPWFTDADKDFLTYIKSQSEAVSSEFEIQISHRQPFGTTTARLTGSRWLDLYRIGSNGRRLFGVYDLSKREFVLFYDGNRLLDRLNYIRIPSENFFDELEKVHYIIFNDID